MMNRPILGISHYPIVLAALSNIVRIVDAHGGLRDERGIQLPEVLTGVGLAKRAIAAAAGDENATAAAASILALAPRAEAMRYKIALASCRVAFARIEAETVSVLESESDLTPSVRASLGFVLRAAAASRKLIGNAEGEGLDFVGILAAVLPYAESRAEDLEMYKAANNEEAAYPGAIEAWAAVEAGKEALGLLIDPARNDEAEGQDGAKPAPVDDTAPGEAMTMKALKRARFDLLALDVHNNCAETIALVEHAIEKLRQTGEVFRAATPDLSSNAVAGDPAVELPPGYWIRDDGALIVPGFVGRPRGASALYARFDRVEAESGQVLKSKNGD